MVRLSALWYVLFIVSEVMFFFAFFWAFTQAYVQLLKLDLFGLQKLFCVLSAWEVPLLNTIILLTSGASCTWAHHAIVLGDRRSAITLICSNPCCCLPWLQVLSISTLHWCLQWWFNFLTATGFHGFHVIIGTTFRICLIRLVSITFLVTPFGLKRQLVLAFVDVVGFSYLLLFTGGEVPNKENRSLRNYILI